MMVKEAQIWYFAQLLVQLSVDHSITTIYVSRYNNLLICSRGLNVYERYILFQN